MSKYEPLWNYVMQHEPGQFSLTFDEIEDVLGFQIDHSFLKYKKDAAFDATSLSVRFFMNL